MEREKPVWPSKLARLTDPVVWLGKKPSPASRNQPSKKEKMATQTG